MKNVAREAELTAPTGVGSGDLLGIKVIKLTKTNDSYTRWLHLARRSKPGASHLFKAHQMSATNSNQKLSNLSSHLHQLPNHQNLCLKTTAKKSASA
jgi:hypothetical protein